MKQLYLLLSLLFVATPAFAAFATVTTPATEPAAVELSVTSQDLTRDAVEAKIGRKLKFKERLALSIARGKVKRAERRKARGGGAPVDGFAIASLVCGILGLLLFIPAIPALVFGIISLGRFKRDPQYRTGKGMAIAGIVLGGVVILLFALLVLIFLSFAGGF